MIEAQHGIVINAGIDSIWDYVQHIDQWATLFPGCHDCELINADDSRWTLKVGAGGLVKTVNVLVHVEEWQGPEAVRFSFQLEAEPVVGSGSYSARKLDDRETEITMAVQVEGSGSMAPMWEAVSKPLLPQLAKTFAASLKSELEEVAVTATPTGLPAPLSDLILWFKNLWRAVLALPPEGLKKIEGELQMLEQNKTVVNRFINAMGAGDKATAAECLTPDATTVAKGFGKFSGVREYETIVGTIEAFTTLFPKGLKPDITSLIAEGDRVVAEFEGAATTYTGQDYHNQYCMVFTMHNGKIRQVNEYFCNKLADEVLWPLVEGMQEEIPPS